MTEPVADSRDVNLEQKVRSLEEQLARVTGSATPQSTAPNPGGQTVTFAPEQTVGTAPTIDRAPTVHAPAAPVEDSAAYTVKAGDTLFTIAQSRYGSRSKRVVDAIIDANRKQVPDPDQIRPGMVLRLPKLEGSAAKSVQRTSDQPANRPVAPAAKASTAQAFRWYQVRPNDRYASIAREVLGDGARWREIHELNKDKFPNPDQIREGVRIKVPKSGRE
jgi:nucleoid-associated protein YgaU